MKLVELKKYNPPPIIWTFIILMVGWAIKTYLPAEYAIPGTIIWGLVLAGASYVGVKSRTVYEVAKGTGVELPPGVQSTPELGDGSLTVKVAESQSVGMRTIL